MAELSLKEPNMLTVHVNMPADFTKRMDEIAREAAKAALRRAAEEITAEALAPLPYMRLAYRRAALAGDSRIGARRSK